MRYIFKKDWRKYYRDGVYRDYLAGDFADGLNHVTIEELVKRKYLVPLKMSPYENKNLQSSQLCNNIPASYGTSNCAGDEGLSKN